MNYPTFRLKARSVDAHIRDLGSAQLARCLTTSTIPPASR